MNNSLPPEIIELSVTEKIQLIEDIWNSISTTTAEIELTEAQKVEFEQRLDRFEQNKNFGSTWDEVKQRISQDE